MKQMLLLGVSLFLFAFFVPLFLSKGQPSNPPDPAESQPRIIAPYIESSKADSQVPLMVLIAGEITAMSMEEYLLGVVAAEMPASFEAEALKAQAISARTYTLYHMLVSPKSAHPEAHVCDDFACCKAYTTRAALSEKWGENYEINLEKIQNAVLDTDGLYLSYEQNPILAVFHSSSAGKTEGAENVWSHALPYLQSVESPETAETVPNYQTEVKISHQEFRETVQKAHPDAVLDGDPSTWITDVARSESGRIVSLKIGGVSLSGTSFRSLMELRSGAVTITVDDTAIAFSVTGYGHGVGMSQYGANIMAAGGADYAEILLWYYQNTELLHVSGLFASA